jgi:signal transduction histidine kinase
MGEAPIDPNFLKQTLKEALAEALHEERELSHELFLEVLEDFALGEAIREGLETKRTTRDRVFSVLEGQS